MVDTPLTGLTPDSLPTLDDIVYTVHDPAGVKAPRQVTLGDILTLFQNQYHAGRIYRTSSMDVPDETLTKLSLGTSGFEVGSGLCDTGNGRFDIQQDGKYAVHGHWEAIGIDSSEYAFAMIYVNGSVAKTGNAYYGRTYGCHPEVFAVLQLTAGDYVELWAWHDEDATIATGTTEEERPEMAIWQIK
jgi:hypothetical protein